MMRAIVAAIALGTASCVAGPAGYPPPPTAGMVETIRYETGPCFGACPVYVVQVSSNGHGLFEGRHDTAVKGERTFAVTPHQYAEFRRRLEPYRPPGPERRVAEPNCGGLVATDLPSVEIIWSAKGPPQRLYVYYGCDMERNAAMFRALREAPEALPIQQFIGAR